MMKKVLFFRDQGHITRDEHIGKYNLPRCTLATSIVNFWP